MLGILYHLFDKFLPNGVTGISIMVSAMAASIGYGSFLLTKRALSDAAAVAVSAQNVKVSTVFETYSFPLKLVSSAQLGMIEGDGAPDENLVIELSERVKSSFGIFSIFATFVGSKKIMIPTRMLQATSAEIAKFATDLRVLRMTALRHPQSMSSRPVVPLQLAEDDDRFGDDAIIMKHARSRQLNIPLATKPAFGRKQNQS